jgi:predicted nucleotidyltransferase
MGGSGGGGSYRLNPDDLTKLREEAQARLDRSRLDSAVNSFLLGELVDINDRDTDLVDRRLSQVEEALEGSLEEFDRLRFGGSVAKHTYVDGLSDIDSLVVLSPELVSESPAEMRTQLQETLLRQLDMSDVDAIRTGRLAVTITYRDGMEVQLLPAVQQDESLAISSPSGESWARINPKDFADRLSFLNRRQGQSVVPAIKLAKAIISEGIPDESRPSGYHIEALAISAFDGYEGPRTPKAMVQRFFEAASSNVLKPISDVTGQSRYVDESLGDSGSAERRALARQLGQIAKRIQQSASVDDWHKLLGE